MVEDSEIVRRNSVFQHALVFTTWRKIFLCHVYHWVYHVDNNLSGSTVRGPTHGRMLITKFCTAWLPSDKSDLSVCNPEYKQRQPQPIRVPHLTLLDYRVWRCLYSELEKHVGKSDWLLCNQALQNSVINILPWVGPLTVCSLPTNYKAFLGLAIQIYSLDVYAE